MIITNLWVTGTTNFKEEYTLIVSRGITEEQIKNKSNGHITINKIG
jgi:hypothetical protein